MNRLSVAFECFFKVMMAQCINKMANQLFDTDFLRKRQAFTLAEVLITLGIIGVVAAITMPSLIGNYQKVVLKNQFKKSYAVMANAIKKAEADLEYSPQCFYWDQSPYGAASCSERDANGECTKYLMSDGASLPSDYNGPRQDCAAYGEAIVKNLNVIKICNGNAFSDGCIPDYEGNDTLKKVSNDALTDYEITSSTSGCSNWRKGAIRTKNRVYVLADGQILMVYGNYVPATLFAIDVNGKKGPNKWGHDLFAFSSIGRGGSSPWLGRGACMPVDKGGVSADAMIVNMSK